MNPLKSLFPRKRLPRIPRNLDQVQRLRAYRANSARAFDPKGCSLAFNEAIETLVSALASFDQKQVAWKQLKERGQLDMAVSELEQRTANDPGRVENVAALGQAYMKKCGVIQDGREQAILAMKADQTLESALSLDPSNWEARYIKAVGMSYWPSQLNRGREVIEQFRR